MKEAQASEAGGLSEQDATLIDLSRPDNSELVRGAPLIVEAAWFFIGLPILRSALVPFSGLRSWLLRLFGAKIGKGVQIKPGVRVKFPWYLEVGDYCWLGEDLWIDNLAQVVIESHSCVSQGVYLCTGNHDWTTPNMKLFRKPIRCGRGSWIGARSVVCPGVSVGAGAIVAAGSVVTKDIPPMEVHGGNPASYLRPRKVKRSP
jgi:putative colanic acid biosynthesis acetyltransferase WcaF